MKKSLSKLPVMVTLVVLAVALLGVYIFMLARPVAYGMEYTHTYDKKEAVQMLATYGGTALTEKDFKDLTVKASFKFKNGKVVTTTYDVDYTLAKDASETAKTLAKAAKETLEKVKGDQYYMRNGSKIILTGESTKLVKEKDFDKSVKDLKKDKDAWKATWKGVKTEVNAFRVKDSTTKTATTYTCAGEIVWAVVLGLVEVALVAFAALSVVYYVGSKKHA